jgi:hypothetical protein
MVRARHAQVPDKGEPCYLDALAPELVDNIVFQIDSVRALGNFITTSHFVYRRFEGRKGPVILRVLQNMLGLVLTDALFLGLFPCSDPGHGPETRMAYWDGIHTMATVYMEMLSSRGHSGRGTDVTIPSFAELSQLCRAFHKVNFLASTYIAAQMRSFGSEGPATVPP